MKSAPFDFGPDAPRRPPQQSDDNAPRRQQQQHGLLALWLTHFTSTFLASFLAFLLALTLFAVGVRIYLAYKVGQIIDAVEQQQQQRQQNNRK